MDLGPTILFLKDFIFPKLQEGRIKKEYYRIGIHHPKTYCSVQVPCPA